MFGLSGVLILGTGILSIIMIRSGLIRPNLPPMVRRSIRYLSNTFGLLEGKRRDTAYDE